jgi:peptide/nickel transport system permease protein
MGIYLVKRIFLGLLIVVTAVTLLYSMMLAVPGDPVDILLGPRATPEVREALRRQMGLDKPVYYQIGHFLLNGLKGDLGTDVFSNNRVSKMIFAQLPYTIALILAGIGWAILIGVPLGCYSATHRNSFLDRLTGLLSVGTIGIPSFVTAVYVLLIFAVELKWLPAIGAGAKGTFIDSIRHLILPAFAIGFGWVGYLSRLVRTSMLEVLGENYIRTARSYGLPQRVIIFRYALKLAILPTIALLGIGIGYFIAAAVFAEIVFSRPGIGKLIYESVLTRNYPVVMGAVFITTILLVVSTIISDLIAAGLDPRIREKL